MKKKADRGDGSSIGATIQFKISSRFCGTNKRWANALTDAYLSTNAESLGFSPQFVSAESAVEGNVMNDFQQKILLTVIDKVAIGLLIGITGYYLNRLLEKLKGEQALRREVEMLRGQTRLKHLQRQIEELYGPLLGLIQYGDAVNQVEVAKIPKGNTGPDVAEIRRYFVEKYYLPLNAQMSDLLRTKIYLLDSDHMPDSFQQFLMHAAQFECLHKLWKDMAIRSDDIRGIEYPATFKQEVARSLDQLRSSYYDQVKLLKMTFDTVHRSAGV